MAVSQADTICDDAARGFDHAFQYAEIADEVIAPQGTALPLGPAPVATTARRMPTATT